jgi:hypothetical protein
VRALAFNRLLYIIWNRSLSFPSIIDDLFNDISIRENLQRKFSADKLLPQSGIFHIKQGQTKPFYKTQPKSIHYDSLNSQSRQQILSSEKILSKFSKGISTV